LNYIANNGTAYSYDLNGNTTTDGLRGMTIGYNVLNLPNSITKNSDNIAYIYSAAGEKLAKRMKEGTYQYYAGNMIYNNGKGLDYVLFDEGVVYKSSGAYTYTYHLKDHLGNTRVAFKPNGSGTETTQVAEYYPFGSNYSTLINGSGTSNKYLYNGKEKQTDELSNTALDEYDYGARFYDPVIGRWNSIDPMSEKYRRWSPYNYCVDNPMRFIDPDGRLIDDYFNRKGEYLGSDESTTDNIQIIGQSSWDFNKTVNGNSVESIPHDKGAVYSDNITDVSLSNKAVISIINHYDNQIKDISKSPNVEIRTEYSTDKRELMSAERGISKINVNVREGKISSFLKTASNIVNSLVHEHAHLNGEKLSEKSDELRSIKAQKNHSSFKKTTSEYKELINRYEKEFQK